MCIHMGLMITALFALMCIWLLVLVLVSEFHMLLLFICTHTRIGDELYILWSYTYVYGLDDHCFDFSYVDVVVGIHILLLSHVLSGWLLFIYVYAQTYQWWAPYPLIMYMCAYIGLMILRLYLLLYAWGVGVNVADLFVARCFSWLIALCLYI